MSCTSILAACRAPRFFTLVMLVGLAAGAVGAATIERASLWREHEIVIDGQDADWQNLTMPVKGQHFSLGLVNDGEFLYVCLPTKDVAARSLIARQGLIVWIDKVGGKKNQFGVHFPIRTDRDRRAPAPDNAPEADAREGESLGSQNEVAILGPGLRKAQVMLIPETRGIEARVGLHGDLLVYELRVPLVRSDAHPYAPDVKPGDTLRVQLETPGVPGGRAPLGRLPGGVTIVGGGGRGVGVGAGVHIGGGGPVGSLNMLEPLDVTMNVRLATGPAR